MKKAKILEIWTPRKWEWPHGDVYYIPLKLDNWENITLGKKSESAFKVWDTVCYEVVEEGKKWKEVKENPFKPKAYNSEWNNRGAMVWMAYKLAFELVYKKEDDFQKTVALANRIYEEAMATYNAGEKSDSKLEENADNDSLPF